MAVLANLAVKIGTQTDELQQGLDQSQSKVQKFKTGAVKTAKSAASAFTMVGGALFATAKKTADYAENVDELSSTTGMSAESVQKMSYALQDAGLESSDAERGMERLNQRIGKAAAGDKKYSEAFENMGVSIRSADGSARGAEQVMGDLADRIQSVEDPTQRAAMAGEVLGTNLGRKMLPALENGSEGLNELGQEAEDLGVVMDKQSRESAADFQSNMDKLKASGQGLAMSIGNRIIPIMNKLMEAFDSAPGIVKGLGVAFAAAAVGVWAMNAALAVNPMTWIIAAIIALVAVVAMYWPEITGAIGDAWDWVVEKTTDVWDWIVDKIQGAAQAVMDGINWLSEIPDKVGGWFSDMASSVGNWIGNMIDFVKSIPSRIMSAIGNTGSLLLNAGKNIINGLINGIKSMIGSVGNTMGNIASKIRSFLPFSPAKDGPLKDDPPNESGEKIGSMVAGGMEDSQGQVSKAAGRMVSGPTAVGNDARAGRGGGGENKVVLDVTGTDEDMKRLIRRMVREHSGNVQKAFGGR